MTTSDRILATFKKLFNTNGTGKVSVTNICEELGISPRNFTYYFPDKQKIVVELYYKRIEETDVVKKK